MIRHIIIEVDDDDEVEVDHSGFTRLEVLNIFLRVVYESFRSVLGLDEEAEETEEIE